MSLAELAISPGRWADSERFADMSAGLVRLGQRHRLASRVLSRALALPPVTAPQQLPPLDWHQALTNVGLAVWAPAIRRLVTREPIRRVISELGASGYRQVLSLPVVTLGETRSLPTPLALAVQISRRGAARAGKRGDRALIYVAALASRFICSSIGLSVRRHAA